MAEEPARKKRKVSNKAEPTFAQKHKPEKPSAVFQAADTGRTTTLSVALPGSILLNAQTEELKAVLASQIARYCAIFGVAEIVVFHEEVPSNLTRPGQKGKYRKSAEEETEADAYLAKLLEYLETPQYLRRALFPMDPSLRLAGILPPLDMPHHLRKTDQNQFREGVISSTAAILNSSRLVDVGLDELVEVTSDVPPGTRVTVQLEGVKTPRLVSPSYPTETLGIPWGYSVRLASSLSTAILPPAPAKPYDLLIGLSERGTPVADLPKPSKFPTYTRALVVLGGLSGLELSIEKEQATLGLSAEESGDLFDFWVNVCPNQGSRTIRTEEALGIGLTALRDRLKR